MTLTTTSKVAYYTGYTEKEGVDSATLEPYQKDLAIGAMGLGGSAAMAAAIPSIQEEYLLRNNPDFAKKYDQVMRQHPSLQRDDITKRKIKYKVPVGDVTEADIVNAQRAADKARKMSARLTLWERLKNTLTGNSIKIPEIPKITYMERTVPRGQSVRSHEAALRSLVERMGNQTLYKAGWSPLELTTLKGSAKMAPLVIASAIIAKRQLSDKK